MACYKALLISIYEKNNNPLNCNIVHKHLIWESTYIQSKLMVLQF